MAIFKTDAFPFQNMFSNYNISYFYLPINKPSGYEGLCLISCHRPTVNSRLCPVKRASLNRHGTFIFWQKTPGARSQYF